MSETAFTPCSKCPGPRTCSAMGRCESGSVPLPQGEARTSEAGGRQCFGANRDWARCKRDALEGLEYCDIQHLYRWMPEQEPATPITLEDDGHGLCDRYGPDGTCSQCTGVIVASDGSLIHRDPPQGERGIERCGAMSPAEPERCVLPKGHEGQHATMRTADVLGQIDHALVNSRSRPKPLLRKAKAHIEELTAEITRLRSLPATFWTVESWGHDEHWVDGRFATKAAAEKLLREKHGEAKGESASMDAGIRKDAARYRSDAKRARDERMIEHYEAQITQSENHWPVTDIALDAEGSLSFTAPITTTAVYERHIDGLHPSPETET